MSNNSKDWLQNNQVRIRGKKTDEIKIISKANEGRKQEENWTLFTDVFMLKIPKNLHEKY